MSKIQPQTDAGRAFLSAWEAAGCPPVEHIIYSGRSWPACSVVFGHQDILTWASASGDNMRFTSDGRFVELEWTTRHSAALDAPEESRGKLMFDLAEPIQCGPAAK